MKTKTKKPILNLDELFPIDEDIKRQEEQFVKHFLEKSKMKVADEDQIIILTDKDLLYMISITIREYVNFRSKYTRNLK